MVDCRKACLMEPLGVVLLAAFLRPGEDVMRRKAFLEPFCFLYSPVMSMAAAVLTLKPH